MVILGCMFHCHAENWKTDSQQKHHLFLYEVCWSAVAKCDRSYRMMEDMLHLRPSTNSPINNLQRSSTSQSIDAWPLIIFWSTTTKTTTPWKKQRGPPIWFWLNELFEWATRKKHCYVPLYCLFYGDPSSSGFVYSPKDREVTSPIEPVTTRGPFFIAQMVASIALNKFQPCCKSCCNS